MMYHLKRSLTGGGRCSCASPVSPAGRGVSGLSGWLSWLLSLISSVMVCLKTLCPQQMQQPLDDTSEHLVHHVKICSEGEDGHDDHHRRVLHFFEGGCPDLAHLIAHVLEETHPALPGAHQLTGLLRLLRLRSLAG